MMNIALMNAKPLLRWLTSIVIILHKDIGKPKMHILRLINTYEADYIFSSLVFFLKKDITWRQKELNYWDQIKGEVEKI